MTVSSTQNRQAYAGDDATSALPTVFPFNAAADLLVLKVTDADGTEATLTLTTHYTVSGGNGSNGTVNLVAPSESGYTYHIIRKEPFLQAVDLVDNTEMSAETLEDELDRLSRADIRLDDTISRAPLVPESEQSAGNPIDRFIKTPSGETLTQLPDAATRANKFLMFNASGDLVLIADLDVDASALQTLLASTATGDGAEMIGVEGGTTVQDFVESLGTAATPQFAGLEVGHASDTTLARAAAGQIQIEGSRVFQRNNIVDTVSQSGGVPTGGIIEKGSNADGEYVRFADGTQICWSPTITGTVSINTSAFGGFRSGGGGPEWTFPAAFSAPPQAILTSSNDHLEHLVIGPQSLSSTKTGARLWRASSSGSVSVSWVGIAVGRWF